MGMTATDELRRLLDERGVEYYDGTETTLWGYEPTSESTGAYRIAADEISGGRMQVRMFNVTPEQAIEATLGSCNCTNSERTGTCHNAAPSYLDFLCSECGFVHYHSDENDSGDGNEWHYCPNCGARVVE